MMSATAVREREAPKPLSMPTSVTCSAMVSTKNQEVVELKEDEDEGVLPPGFRFHPTDEELLCYYLRRRVDGRPTKLNVIPDIDLYRFEPWELPGHQPGSDEKFFFTPKDRKYPSGLRSNRATPRGYWKATGKDRPVYGESSLAEKLMGRQKAGSSLGTAPGEGGPGAENVGQAVCIGYKKTLVFYLGRAPAGEKSDWVMHEYRLSDESDGPATSAGGPTPASPAGSQAALATGGGDRGGGGAFFPRDNSTQSNLSQGDSLGPSQAAPEGDPGSSAGTGAGTALRTPLSSWVVIRVYAKRLLPQGSDSENCGAALGGPGSLSGKAGYGSAAGPGVVKVRQGGVSGSGSFSRRSQGQQAAFPLSRSVKGESATPALAPASSGKAAAGWLQVPGVDSDRALGVKKPLGEQALPGGHLGGQKLEAAEALPGGRTDEEPRPNASTGLGRVGPGLIGEGAGSGRQPDEAAGMVAKGAPATLQSFSSLQRPVGAQLDDGVGQHLAGLAAARGGQQQLQPPPQQPKEISAEWSTREPMQGLAPVALTEQQKQLLLLTEEGKQLLMLQEQQIQARRHAKAAVQTPAAPPAPSSTAAAAAAAAAASAAARAILLKEQQQHLHGAAGAWQQGADARGPSAASSVALQASGQANRGPPTQQPEAAGATAPAAQPMSLLQKLGVNLSGIRSLRPQANRVPPRPGLGRATQTTPQGTTQAPAGPASAPASGAAVVKSGEVQAGVPPALRSQGPTGAAPPSANPPAKAGLERRFSGLLETAFQNFLQRGPQGPLQDPSSATAQAQARPSASSRMHTDASAMPAGHHMESPGQSLPMPQAGHSEAQQPLGLPNALSTSGAASGEARPGAGPTAEGEAAPGPGSASGPGPQIKAGPNGEGFGSSPFTYSLQWLEEMLSDAGAVWGPPAGDEPAGAGLQAANRRSPLASAAAWTVSPGPGTVVESSAAPFQGEARAAPAPAEAPQLQGQAGPSAVPSAEGAGDAIPAAAAPSPGPGESGAGAQAGAGAPSASGSKSQRVEFVRAVSDLLLRELLELQAGEEGQLVVGTAAAAAAAAAAATAFNPGILLPGMHGQDEELAAAMEAAAHSVSADMGTSQTSGRGHKRQHSSSAAPAPDDTRDGQARLQAEAALASNLGFMTASPSAWAMGQTPTLPGAPWAWIPQGAENPAHPGHPSAMWEGPEEAGGETETEQTEAEQGWAASKRSRMEGSSLGPAPGAAPGALQDEPEVSSPAPLHVPWQSSRPGGL